MIRIAVFAPSPLFTVTIEERGEGRSEVHFHAGGQGVWVARMARVLGASPLLCAPFGGESGAVVRRLVHDEGIDVRAVAITGANGGYVHDRRSGERRPLVDVQGPVLSRHEQDDLYSAALAAAIDCGLAVLAGPMPPDAVDAQCYRRLARDLDANGVRVVADLSGDALRAVEGGVEVLKLSHDEAVESGFSRDHSEAELRRAIARLHARGHRNVVVSRAHAPALALLDERWVEICAPHLEAADPRGAGDSMTAAIAVGIAEGLALEDAVRLGAAAGALNVTRHGLATGNARDIDVLATKVELRVGELLA